MSLVLSLQYLLRENKGTVMDKSEIVTLSAPDSPAAEAYRALRVNLDYASLDISLKTLVVSAPAPEGDRSVWAEVAVNLAVVAAQAGQTVVLVDADLRRPCLHEFLELSNEVGLTQAIVSLDEPLPLCPTDVPGLSVLTSGALPPNPVDILSSQKMSDLLENLAGQADLVILSAPPVTISADAAVLGAKTDGLLLAVRSGHTRRDRIEQAKEALERFKVHLLGAVLTDAPEGKLLTAY